MKLAQLRSLGPAIIVASVVLGPGSILVSSRVGAEFGYDLIWLVACAAILMAAMTALAAHLGVTLTGTLGDEIARRAGRPLAVLVGVVLFLVVACFQFSNNVAVVAALEPFLGGLSRGSLAFLVVLNLGVVAALYGMRSLYGPIERMMKLLVGIMIVGFLGNVLLTQPSLSKVCAGLLPSLPASLTENLLPMRVDGAVHDTLRPVQALIGTTFSVAGAFYAAYLVRQKGWTRADLGRGRLDSIVGISVLALLTLTIMVTAAAVFHGQEPARELESAADIAVQLEPLFGAAAKYLFSAGLLAGAFSSFLVNVMIGGTVLSDGLGLGGDMDQPWPKALTVVALLVGMGVAIAVLNNGESPVRLIIFAQALTVLGNPVLAGVLLWLAARASIPLWVRIASWLGFFVVLALALRTGINIYFKVTGA